MTQIKVRKWGFIIDEASLYEADEIELFALENGLKVWRRFLEGSWNYHLSLEWDNSFSKEQKREIRRAIKNIIN